MRTMGRFLGLCLAVMPAAGALCAAPTGASMPDHHSLIRSSDVPAQSTTIGYSHALRQRSGHVDEPDTAGRPGSASAVPAGTRVTAGLQTPAMKYTPGIQDDDSSRTSGKLPGDGVQRSLSARSAVLDGNDRAVSDSNLGAMDVGQAVDIKVRALNDHERAAYGVTDGGLMVTAVGLGAAQQAGFKQGDVVLMLDGVSLTSAAQFYKLTHQLPHDRPVPVLVRRSTSDLFLPLGTPHR